MFSLASAVYHDRQVAISFPFDRVLVDRLKLEIPAYARKYVPETKEWIVEATYAPRAVGILLEHFPDARIENAPSSASVSSQVPECAILYVTADAPLEVVQAAYRALSKLYHPDRASVSDQDHAHERMTKLNAAHEILRDRLGS